MTRGVSLKLFLMFQLQFNTHLVPTWTGGLAVLLREDRVRYYLINHCIASNSCRSSLSKHCGFQCKPLLAVIVRLCCFIDFGKSLNHMFVVNCGAGGQLGGKTVQ